MPVLFFHFDNHDDVLRFHHVGAYLESHGRRYHSRVVEDRPDHTSVYYHQEQYMCSPALLYTGAYLHHVRIF